MYPLNWPLSKMVAFLGVPLSIKIEVIFDPEAKVYIATSPNVRGLVVEAATLDETKKEVELVLPDLISLNHFNVPAQGSKHTHLHFSTDLHAA